MGEPINFRTGGKKLGFEKKGGYFFRLLEKEEKFFSLVFENGGKDFSVTKTRENPYFLIRFKGGRIFSLKLINGFWTFLFLKKGTRTFWLLKMGGARHFLKRGQELFDTDNPNNPAWLPSKLPLTFVFALGIMPKIRPILKFHWLSITSSLF